MEKQQEKRRKSEVLSEFLKFLQDCENEYELAYEGVRREDKRLQDLLHEMEFAPDKLARNRVATKLHYSRVERRKNKDIVTENEEIVTFFKNQKSVINGMKELLGRQRKKEDYLNGERTATFSLTKASQQPTAGNCEKMAADAPC